MRAVVIKIKENKAAVLMKDGTLRYIDDMGYEQGTVLELPDTLPLQDAVPITGHINKNKFRLPYKFMYSAAACLAVITLSGAMVSYACPVSKVPVSSDPSITLGVNVYGKVVEINALDPERETLIKDIRKEIAGKNIDYAEKIVSDVIDCTEENTVQEPSAVHTGPEPEAEEADPEIIPDDPSDTEVLPSLPADEESAPEDNDASTDEHNDNDDPEESSDRISGEKESDKPDGSPSPENKETPGNSPVIENKPVPENTPASGGTNIPGIIPDQRNGSDAGSIPEAVPTPTDGINVPSDVGNPNPPTYNGTAPSGDDSVRFEDPGSSKPDDNAPDHDGSDHGDPGHDGSDRGGSDHGTSDHGGSDHGGHGGGPGGR